MTMTDDLECRFCARPCANGTGRAAHERHCSARESPAVCKRCHEDYPRGALDAHLKVCTASATAELGRTTPVAREQHPPRVADRDKVVPRTAGELVFTLTIAGSPRQIEDALRKLRA